MKKILAVLLLAAAASSLHAQVKWHSADNLPLIGKAVDDASTTGRYQRIPDSLLNTVRGVLSPDLAVTLPVWLCVLRRRQAA